MPWRKKSNDEIRKGISFWVPNAFAIFKRFWNLVLCKCRIIIPFLLKAILVPRILHCFFFNPATHCRVCCTSQYQFHRTFWESIYAWGTLPSAEEIVPSKNSDQCAITLWQYDQKMNGQNQPILSNVIWVHVKWISDWESQSVLLYLFES